MIANTITVADKKEDKDIIYSTKEIIITHLHFISGNSYEGPTFVRIRYRQEKQACTVEKKSDGWHIVFDIAQNAVAVGQSAVLYNEEVTLGGGIIDAVI